MEYRSAFARCCYAEGWAEGYAEGWAEGYAEGWAEAVIEVLDVRGFTVPEGVGKRILSSRDIRLLKVWLRRAATVSAIDELFD